MSPRTTLTMEEGGRQTLLRRFPRTLNSYSLLRLLERGVQLLQARVVRRGLGGQHETQLGQALLAQVHLQFPGEQEHRESQELGSGGAADALLSL